MDLNKKFFDEYHFLRNLRKSKNIRKNIPSETSRSVSTGHQRSFYYRDAYEICSVKQFLNLYQISQVLDKKARSQENKNLLAQKKNLLQKLKEDQYNKKHRVFTLSRSFKLKTNQIFSPKAVSPLSHISINENKSQEIKWFTTKEVDNQLAKVMTSEYKSFNNLNVTEQLVNSPMFKKGAKGVDRAFNYYIDNRFKRRNLSVGYIDKNQPLLKQIDLFQKDSENSKIKEFNKNQNGQQEKPVHKFKEIRILQKKQKQYQGLKNEDYFKL